MADDFANAPLALSVAIRFAIGRNVVQQNIQRVELGTQHRQNVVLADLRDIPFIVGRILRLIRTIHNLSPPDFFNGGESRTNLNFSIRCPAPQVTWHHRMANPLTIGSQVSCTTCSRFSRKRLYASGSSGRAQSHFIFSQSGSSASRPSARMTSALQTKK